MGPQESIQATSDKTKSQEQTTKTHTFRYIKVEIEKEIILSPL